jgi:hypothetical protein
LALSGGVEDYSFSFTPTAVTLSSGQAAIASERTAWLWSLLLIAFGWLALVILRLRSAEWRPRK